MVEPIDATLDFGALEYPDDDGLDDEYLDDWTEPPPPLIRLADRQPIDFDAIPWGPETATPAPPPEPAEKATLIEPERRQYGIIPSMCAERHKSEVMQYLPGFSRPELPGPAIPAPMPVIAYLPGLEPDAPPSPAAILALFDQGGGHSLTAARIFVEALLSLPTSGRDGQLWQMHFALREVAGVWLGWDLRYYRPTHPKYGMNLKRAIGEVASIAVPVKARRGPPGFYHPLLVRAISGWTLNDGLLALAQVPPGAVGPPIDRAMLRVLGKASETSWRAYLSLVFDWDRYGAVRGHLIKPERPKVERTDAGVVARADGSPLVERGKPVYNAHHPRAIPTGGMEPNPARIQGKTGPGGYPEYSADDLVRLAFPQSVFDDRRRRHEARRRAVSAVKRIETLDGCCIEEVGSGQRKRWRVMPPQHFGSAAAQAA